MPNICQILFLLYGFFTKLIYLKYICVNKSNTKHFLINGIVYFSHAKRLNQEGKNAMFSIIVNLCLNSVFFDYVQTLQRYNDCFVSHFNLIYHLNEICRHFLTKLLHYHLYYDIDRAIEINIANMNK